MPVFILGCVTRARALSLTHTVHRTAYMYIMLAPLAMAADLGYYTAAFNAILAYTFFGLDELARQMENPFGEEQQCLALDAISRAIEISAAEVLGLPVPPPLQPVEGILM